MTPNTRLEIYLEAIRSGDSSALPTPITREELYLYDIAVNGGGGGGGVAYKILDAYDTYAELIAAHPVGNAGDAYLVGDPSHVYVWLVESNEWNDAGEFTAIAGPKGDKGDKGNKGDKGEKGDTGEQGPQGIQGETGPKGSKGEKGDKGDTGSQGPKGDDGDTPTVVAGTTETVAYTEEAEVESVPTATGVKLNFKIPQGRPGGGGGGGDVQTVCGKGPDATGNVNLNKADLSLGNVDNTSDLDKPVSTAQGTINTGFNNRITALEENPVNPFQFTEMPEASEHPQEVVEYIGADTADYKRGYFYRSTPVVISGELSYVWQQLDVQPSSADYETVANKPQINGVTLQSDKTGEQLGLQNQIQYSTLPTADATTLGKIYQYVGATDANYTKGYFYQCRYDSSTGTYSWVKTDVSGNSGLDSRVTQLETNQGDIASLEVTGVTDLVAAINKVNAKAGITRYEYTEPNLIIYYNDGSTFQIAVSSILNETQIGELANVLDSTIADGNVLQYDSALQKYKPYAILTALQTLLQTSKDYTDQEIASAIVAGAYVCDAKPSYDAEHDTVIYIQNGVTKTTTQTDARFYYYVSGDPFCTSWIDDIEFTFSVADVDFEDYVNKNTDVVSTYTEDMLDKTKIPDVASLDALLAIVKTYLALKVNTADIIDNLTSTETTKPLSAKQGKVLKDSVDTKQDKMQFATMPVAAVEYLGMVVQYVGPTGLAYTKGYYYECKYDNDTTTYYWDLIKYSADTDSALDPTSENPVQNKVITDALDDKQDKNLSAPITVDGVNKSTVEGAVTALNAYADKKLEFYQTLPSPVAALEGKIVQYTGADTASLTNGYFYQCLEVTPATDPKTYEWLQKDVQVAVAVDNATIVRDNVTGELSAVKATANSVGVSKPDGTTTFIDANGVMSGLDAGNGITKDAQNKLNADTRIFEGTREAWNVLSVEERVKYTHAGFPDEQSGIVDVVPVKDSLHLITSGGVYKEVESRSTLGAHNLDGSIRKSQTIYGITYTVNADGTVKANGTSTGSAQLDKDKDNVPFIAPFSAQVVLSGGVYTYAHVYPWDYTDDARPYTDSTKTTRVSSSTNAYGDTKVSFYMEEGHSYLMVVRVLSGNTVNNIVFKPMLCLATDADDTYKPYVPTNAECLSEDANAELGAHQYLITSLAEIKALNTGGTWSNNVYTPTSGGLTFTVNSDLSVTVNSTGEVSGNFDFILQKYKDANSSVLLSNGKSFFGKSMRLSGTPKETGSKVWLTFLRGVDADTNAGDTGNGVVFTPQIITATQHYIAIRVDRSQVVNGIKISPLLTLASDTSKKYTSGAMTNQQLTGNMIYSTDEVDTGKVWIDGRHIYRKVVSLGTLPNTTTKSVAHGITNIGTFIHVGGFCIGQSNEILPLPLTWPTATSIIGIYATTQNVIVSTATDRTTYTGYVFVEYTKTT